MKANRKQFYEIQLEDRNAPTVIAVNTYYGTQDDICELMIALEKSAETADFYKSTIHAFEQFLDGDQAATHMVAGKEVRLMTPMRFVCEADLLQCDAKWSYTVPLSPEIGQADEETKAAQLLMHAGFMDANQVLLQDGDRYIRCTRFCFEDVKFRDPVGMWHSLGIHYGGFPEIFRASADASALNFRLFVPEQTSRFKEDCVFAMGSPWHLKMENISRELIGISI